MNDCEQYNPETGRYELAEPLPFYSGWECFKQDMQILWLKLTGLCGYRGCRGE